MRKQERQVIENAIKTISIVIESECEKEEVNYKFCISYLKSTIEDLNGYGASQYRFGGMKEKDFNEFTNIVNEFKLLMYDKINNANEDL